MTQIIITRIIIAWFVASLLAVVAWFVFLSLRDSRCQVCHREWAIFTREDLTLCRRCRQKYDVRMRIVRGPSFFWRLWGSSSK